MTMRLEVISWEEFQVGIAPLWRSDDPTNIPILNNPYRIIQYPLGEWPEQILYYPCKLVVGDRDVAWTSIQNISPDVTRIRGIYVKEGERGLGYGHVIAKLAQDLFPSGFYRSVGFWREDSAPRFIAHSNMSIVPGTDWFWSDFSQVRMRMLYRDRGRRLNDLTPNRLFIEINRETYGLGGTNNLNRAWTEEEWHRYADRAADAYPDVGINV
jgi:hypothetical protein